MDEYGCRRGGDARRKVLCAVMRWGGGVKRGERGRVLAIRTEVGWKEGLGILGTTHASTQLIAHISHIMYTKNDNQSTEHGNRTTRIIQVCAHRWLEGVTSTPHARKEQER